MSDRPELVVRIEDAGAGGGNQQSSGGGGVGGPPPQSRGPLVEQAIKGLQERRGILESINELEIRRRQFLESGGRRSQIPDELSSQSAKELSAKLKTLEEALTHIFDLSKKPLPDAAGLGKAFADAAAIPDPEHFEEFRRSKAELSAGRRRRRVRKRLKARTRRISRTEQRATSSNETRKARVLRRFRAHRRKRSHVDFSKFSRAGMMERKAIRDRNLDAKQAAREKRFGEKQKQKREKSRRSDLVRKQTRGLRAAATATNVIGRYLPGIGRYAHVGSATARGAATVASAAASTGASEATVGAIVAVGVAAGSAAAALGLVAGTAYMLNRTMSDTVDRIGFFGGQTATQLGMTAAEGVMRDVGRAQKLDPVMSKYVRSSFELGQSIDDLNATLLQEFGPLLNNLIDGLSLIAQGANWTAKEFFGEGKDGGAGAGQTDGIFSKVASRVLGRAKDDLINFFIPGFSLLKRLVTLQEANDKTALAHQATASDDLWNQFANMNLHGIFAAPHRIPPRTRRGRPLVGARPPKLNAGGP